MTAPTHTGHVPEGILLLLQRATGDGLLHDAETMAAALADTGWVRQTSSGSWSYEADASWTVQSTDHAPHVSLFTHGEHQHLLHLADALRALLTSGQVGPVQPGEPDPDWSTWTGADVVISLNVTPQRELGKHLVPAVLQLALERADTPTEGLPPDPERTRRLAREGSPLTRWYLAGHDHLPEDVVALLAADADAAVVAALDANERQRRSARDEHRPAGAG